MTAAVPAVLVRFRILYVCVGNVCRSVLAERLTRRGIDARLGSLAGLFHVASAGTEAAPGAALHPYVRDVLGARGADCSGFASRRLTPELVAGSDLVLTATAAERDRAMALAPAALSRTFTIREFARLAGSGLVEDAPGNAVEHARAAVAAVHGLRGLVPYVDPSGDDIADPERTLVAFDACAGTIAASLDQVLAVVCPRLVPAALHADQGERHTS